MGRPSSTVVKVKDLIKNYAIDPEWQRNCNLWAGRTVETYVNDVIDGRPMPPILAMDSEDGKVVIDGKQRICNLINALEDEDITEEDAKAISEYKFFVNHYNEDFFAKKSNDDLDSGKVIDFFYKTNSMGTRLNAQEIRRAVHFNQPYIKFAKKEKKSDRFLNFLDQFQITDNDIKNIGQRFLDEEFILKVLGFYYTEDFVSSPYTAKVIDSLSDTTQKELSESFGLVLEVFNALYHDTDTPSQIRFISKYKGIMPIILGLLGQYETKDIRKNRHQIGEFINSFWFMRHDDLAERFGLNYNSGSGFYRAVVKLVVERLDNI